ncbi:hypothetical protein A4X09_0g1978 [Tilletia walkeri]|uniref:Uncharacterized protein n=1 Tax=Tilletia walkeri TaxID=117179 RepID=A0A8X7NDA2_9BASI|nr:hypothetical protein A4X09_0g1978 [Tilletia walkeri]
MFNKALLQYKVARAAPPLFIVAKPNLMTLPKEWEYTTKPAVDVGSVHDRTTISIRDLLQVYALNKSRCPDPANAVSFALLRMEAVKAGWVDVANQPEIARADPWDDDTARRSFLTDYRRIMDECPRAARAAYCLPLISEFIFRATGHPWRADEERLYDDLYRSTLIACHLPGVIGYLPPWLLYHEALHWIGPARQMEAPAGTALLDTSVQVIDALESLNLAEEFGRSGAYDFELLKTVLEAVKKDPFKYHQSYHRYGVDPPTTAELSTLEKAKEVAIKFAPVAQAFIESGLGDASLSNQNALERHADLNAKMKKRCKTFFRKFRRQNRSANGTSI